jgi:hypothetical protein
LIFSALVSFRFLIFFISFGFSFCIFFRFSIFRCEHIFQIWANLKFEQILNQAISKFEQILMRVKMLDWFFLPYSLFDGNPKFVGVATTIASEVALSWFLYSLFNALLNNSNKKSCAFHFNAAAEGKTSGLKEKK